MTASRIAVFPGTFDPVTNGHLDLVRRAARMTDHLIVAVAGFSGKSTLFSTAERVALLEQELDPIRRAGHIIDVTSFSNLLIDFVRSCNARMVIRGLRVVSDFEYEFQMAGMNARLDPEIETAFLMAREAHQFIASRFVKDIAQLGGDVSGFAPPRTVAALKAKFRKQES